MKNKNMHINTEVVYGLCYCAEASRSNFNLDSNIVEIANRNYKGRLPV